MYTIRNSTGIFRSSCLRWPFSRWNWRAPSITMAHGRLFGCELLGVDSVFLLCMNCVVRVLFHCVFIWWIGLSRLSLLLRKVFPSPVSCSVFSTGTRILLETNDQLWHLRRSFGVFFLSSDTYHPKSVSIFHVTIGRCVIEARTQVFVNEYTYCTGECPYIGLYVIPRGGHHVVGTTWRKIGKIVHSRKSKQCPKNDRKRVVCRVIPPPNTFFRKRNAERASQKCRLYSAGGQRIYMWPGPICSGSKMAAKLDQGPFQKRRVWLRNVPHRGTCVVAGGLRSTACPFFCTYLTVFPACHFTLIGSPKMNRRKTGGE